MSKKLDNWFKYTWRGVTIALVFSVLLLIWLASFYLATTGFAALPKITTIWDLTAILFGAAQVSLFVISILIGFLTIVGWQAVERKISEAVEKVTKKRLANVENEARGRSFAIMGYVIGENSITPDYAGFTNEERLREAIRYCDQAYNFLKGTDLPAEFLALNNFLGYSCALGETARRGYILECARKLRKAAEEHASWNLQLTYARTVFKFSLEPQEIAEACSIVRDVLSNSQLNEKQKREAEYLTPLCKQR
jgi:membrane protein implicated in regulation of membrane protease activity